MNNRYIQRCQRCERIQPLVEVRNGRQWLCRTCRVGDIHG